MKVRVLSAVFILPLVAILLLRGGWLFILLVISFVMVAGFEYKRMLGRKGYLISLPIIWSLILLWMAAAYWQEIRILEPGLALIILTGAGRQLTSGSRTTEPTASWALTLAGGIYLGVGGFYLQRLRAQPDGLWWLLSALIIVWVADTGAYVVGRRWGRHKMAPQISPGKSWEGYGAEIVTGVLLGTLCGIFGLAISSWQLTPFWGGMLGLLLALVTPLGDFFVSMIKREVGVKDTSSLIPGHGGAFDRLDSILWAGILTWFFRELLVLWIMPIG